MLSNSSLALEILTHDSHQHAEAQTSQHDMHAMHDMQNMNDEGATISAFDHGGDDCVCDDICCLSSIDFGRSVNADRLFPVAKSHIPNPNFYRSISIDLLVPPPTR